MNGLRLEAGRFSHPLGGSTCWRTQDEPNPFGRQNPQYGVDNGRLANAWTSGDDHDLRPHGQADRRFLAIGKCQAGLLFDPRDGLLEIDPGPGQSPFRKFHQPLADGLFGPVQSREEDTRRSVYAIRYDRSIAQFKAECGADKLWWNIEKRDGERHQLLGRQATMTFFHGFGESIGDAGPDARHRGLVDPQPHGDRVSSLEADAGDIASQAI